MWYTPGHGEPPARKAGGPGCQASGQMHAIGRGEPWRFGDAQVEDAAGRAIGPSIDRLGSSRYWESSPSRSNPERAVLALGGARHRGRPAGEAGGEHADSGRWSGVGSIGAGDPDRDEQAGRRSARAAACNRHRPSRPAGRLRGRASGGVGFLPHQDLRHGARPDRVPPCLFPLRRLRSRGGATRRGARSSWRVAHPRAGGNGGPGRSCGPLRQRPWSTRRARRGDPVGQARGTLRRSRRAGVL